MFLLLPYQGYNHSRRSCWKRRWRQRRRKYICGILSGCMARQKGLSRHQFKILGSECGWSPKSVRVINFIRNIALVLHVASCKIEITWSGGVYVINAWQKHDFQEIHRGACKHVYFLDFQPRKDRYLHLKDSVGWESAKIHQVKLWEQILCCN